MDGREDREGCEEGEEACYRCEARARAKSRAEETGGQDSGDSEEDDREIEAEIYRGRAQRRMYGQAERRRQAEESMEVETFRTILDTWSAGCPWCRATGEAEEVWGGHTLDGCQEEAAGEIRRMVGRVKQGVRWEAYSCCFDCGVPQEICRRYESRGAAGGFRRVEGRACQYPGVLMRTVVSLWGAAGVAGAKRLYGWMRAQGATVDEDDIDGWIRWMGRKVRWGGLESNEMCRMAVQLWRWRQEQEEEG
ncbi:hypothetical protein C8A03DRAFT_19808 [Achaetomium macrosporum]|uniref:Uncharacterized protein n=1 Tax=Achaetomium macrosporum TaxID=79813 RepID=A0AAN7C1E2_9PEZI|nr:hypothetical protein C8A03DRAFT_19808 [Achaetomium macrosporum]